jgi:uncharacterized membrane protein
LLALLRWIHHLSDLGSMDATLEATEAAARACLIRARRLPSLGGVVMTQETTIPAQASPLTAPATGYVQFINMPGISERLKSDQTRVYLYARPGDYLIEGQIIGHATGVKDGETGAIARRLTIGTHRTFEQDASYGLLVLSETASRALSPGINDPGTAIAVICRQEKLLLEWAHAEPKKTKPLFPRIFLPDTARHAMIENAFAGTARDGADQIEVALRLLDGLGRIADAPDTDLAEAARDMSTRALEYADAALPLDRERRRLRDATGGISFLP